MSYRGFALAADLAVKAALLVLVLYVAVQRDEVEYQGRTMTARLLVYPLVALAVPVCWWLLRVVTRRPIEYPYVLDMLVVAPFALDLLGVVLELDGTIRGWDQIVHFVNWALLAGAFGWLALRLGIGPLEAAGLALGFGAATAIVWEVVEYETLHASVLERTTEYRGTMLDLAFALAGSFAAALVVAGLARRRSRLS